MLKRFLHVLLVAVVGVTLGLVAAPTTAQAAEPTLYTQPGDHAVNDRFWHTDCEMYSPTVVRCSTDIWATTTVRHEGTYYGHDAWVFNNLTYLPSPRASWGDNPLANTGSWTAADGRAWRTECDTDVTGGNGCRSYVMSTIVVFDGGVYKVRTLEVLNNIVQFSGSGLDPVTTIPAAAPAVPGMPVDTAFVPPVNPNPVLTCKASYYGGYWHGRKTANGEIFNTWSMTAAHKTFRFNTMVEVTNPANGKSVTVRINNRGPYISGRCLDLSTAAMRELGGINSGVITVNYQVVG